MNRNKEISKLPNLFNPRMLVLAREYSEMTQTQLAKLLGVSQGTISKIEEGLKECDENLLGVISKVLKRPEKFFTQHHQFNLTLEGSFRRKSSLSKKMLRSTDARMNIERLQILQLVGACSLELPEPPVCNPDEYRNGVPEIAKMIRQHLEIPRGPVVNVVECIEKAGCIVRFIDFGTLLVDGFAVLTNSPVIFINKAMSADRRRLTLAHEFGHVIMHRGVVRPNMEDEAFEFAGEFLMPAQEIKSSLYPLNIEKLARLKLKWKVSMAAILQHSLRIGAIKERYYRYLRTQLSKHGYNKSEPYEGSIELEPPELLTSIFRHYKNDLEYTIEDMQSLLSASQEEVKSLNRPNHERFSIV